MERSKRLKGLHSAAPSRPPSRLLARPCPCPCPCPVQPSHPPHRAHPPASIMALRSWGHSMKVRRRCLPAIRVMGPLTSRTSCSRGKAGTTQVTAPLLPTYPQRDALPCVQPAGPVLRCLQLLLCHAALAAAMIAASRGAAAAAAASAAAAAAAAACAHLAGVVLDEALDQCGLAHPWGSVHQDGEGRRFLAALLHHRHCRQVDRWVGG